jgi:hypothetical protein
MATLHFGDEFKICFFRVILLKFFSKSDRRKMGKRKSSNIESLSPPDSSNHQHHVLLQPKTDQARVGMESQPVLPPHVQPAVSAGML